MADTLGPLNFEREFNPDILTREERRELELLFDELQSSQQTQRDIIQQLSEKFGEDLKKRFEDGMVRYSNGARVPMETWAEMYARTSSMDAMRSAQVDFSVNNGMVYGEIRTDGSPCPLCSPWSRVMISLDGADDRVPSLDDAKNEMWGHPNCECIVLGLTESQSAERLQG